MPAHEVSVRRATPEDIPTLVVLMEAFYAEADYGLDNEWASAAFRKLLSNPSLGCVWLAHTAESAIGHAVLTARYTMEHAASSGYVDDLYVEPDRRRQGIGFALLESLFHECRARELASSDSSLRCILPTREPSLYTRGMGSKSKARSAAHCAWTGYTPMNTSCRSSRASNTIKRTSYDRLSVLPPAAHVERWAGYVLVRSSTCPR